MMAILQSLCHRVGGAGGAAASEISANISRKLGDVSHQVKTWSLRRQK